MILKKGITQQYISHSSKTMYAFSHCLAFLDICTILTNTVSTLLQLNERKKSVKTIRQPCQFQCMPLLASQTTATNTVRAVPSKITVSFEHVPSH